MKVISKALVLFVYFILGIGTARANTTANQTDQLSPVLPVAGLPFRILIQQANFQLPVGIHSGVVGTYKGLWIFIAGRINGMHGFGTNPFPPDAQNMSIYVVDPSTGRTYSRLLTDPSSGLTQKQIDTLTVTSPQGYQEKNTLYMTGGYGIDTATGTFGTKPVLTAFNLPGIVKWVMEPNNRNHSVIKNIAQVYNPIFQVTGGEMFKVGNTTLLVFGQNFTDVYTSNSNGDYTEQVRRFKIINANGQLAIKFYYPTPFNPDPNFRRRDLNVVPILENINNRLKQGFVAYAGVFTPATGVWTVPVVLDEIGNPTMADPNLPDTFKQAMNQYVCATAGLYSKRTGNMYDIFLGGITYGFFTNGVFQTDSEIPFTNEVTTIKMDNSRHFTQYLMDTQYPVIPSTNSNPGNPLLFGAGAYFMPNNIPHFSNGVISLDNIRRPTVIGYVVGGIQSTLPNTNTKSDSAASPYVFRVILIPI